MFHPGRVVEVLSPKSRNIDSSEDNTQVMLNMWDDNLFTFNVASEIADKVSTDDIVLVDYSPISQGSPVPKRIVTKVLKGGTAKKIWDNYKAYYAKKEAAKTSNKNQQFKMPVEDHSYMG